MEVASFLSKVIRVTASCLISTRGRQRGSPSLLCVLLCAARGADPDADQAPPAAGGAQQPAGAHSSSANGPRYGGAQR